MVLIEGLRAKRRAPFETFLMGKHSIYPYANSVDVRARGGRPATGSPDRSVADH
jgi:hypothetical protein